MQIWEIAIRFGFFFLVAMAGIATKEKHRAFRSRISLLEHTQRLEKQIIEVSEYEQQRMGTIYMTGCVNFWRRSVVRPARCGWIWRSAAWQNYSVTAAEIEKLLGESVAAAFRDLAHGLVPVQLDEGGLPAALHEFTAIHQSLVPPGMQL